MFSSHLIEIKSFLFNAMKISLGNVTGYHVISLPHRRLKHRLLTRFLSPNILTIADHTSIVNITLYRYHGKIETETTQMITGKPC